MGRAPIIMLNEDGPYIMIDPPFLTLRKVYAAQRGCEVGTCYNLSSEDRARQGYEFVVQDDPSGEYNNMDSGVVGDTTKAKLIHLYKELLQQTEPLHPGRPLTRAQDAACQSRQITAARARCSMSDNTKAALPEHVDLHTLLLGLTRPLHEIDEIPSSPAVDGSQKDEIRYQAYHRLLRAAEDKPWLLGAVPQGQQEEMLRQDKDVQTVLDLWDKKHKEARRDEEKEEIEQEWTPNVCAVMACCASMQVPPPRQEDVDKWQKTPHNIKKLSQKSQHGFRIWLHGKGVSDNMYPKNDYPVLERAINELLAGSVRRHSDGGRAGAAAAAAAATAATASVE